jgi:hypothetical protein
MYRRISRLPIGSTDVVLVTGTAVIGSLLRR